MFQAAGLGLVAEEGEMAEEERSKEKLDSPSAILRVGARLGTVVDDIFDVEVVFGFLVVEVVILVGGSLVLRVVWFGVMGMAWYWSELRGKEPGSGWIGRGSGSQQ
ncbi:uncharacterized protein PpBr36_10163 [Pyricularia pennisetigena]|uniref:uncharacterized protein n=1 Tax=Pyricularia pennisetigena TaxID=1578925 RepID=UPI00114DAABB|nr:uncharacterized protein PpBr36_10163 [Pyricularia pennisetigena]TLS21406.1 hypothetical protein PpBr36_10163 [Pyricularia pennisetigena]